VIYIIKTKREEKRLIENLTALFNAAVDGEILDLRYDETVFSSLAVKLIEAVSVLKYNQTQIKKDRDKLAANISDISHQIKNPAANIKLYSEILQSLENLSEQDRDIVQSLGVQTDKLVFLMDALVKMSRFETGVMELTPKKSSVETLIAEAVSDILPAISSKNIALNIDVSKKLFAVFDTKWTKEAIVNIIDNAVKYTDENGSIKITAIAYELFVRIDIADNGMGFPEREKNKIFKRFYRSEAVKEKPGVGVGLYLSREILSHENGFIKAKSTVGKGSVFSVFLPR
jgi:signal transduction histidine kinase